MLYSVHTLRLLAALGVIVHHSATRAHSSFMVGAAGVDLFFVISGLVISLSTKSDDAVSDFCAKRFIRVVPLYWIAMATVMAGQWLVGGKIPTATDIIHSATLIPAPGWFPSNYPVWTLTFEMMFYAVFAVLLGTLRRDVTMVAALVMGALAAAHLPIFDAPNYNSSTEYCIEFAFGLTLAAAIKRGLRIDPAVGTICIAASIALLAWNSTSPVIRVLEWGVPSLLMVIGAISIEQAAIFRNRVLIFGGAASYSFYLFHVTAIEAVLKFAARFGLALDQYPVTSFAIFVAASIAAGGIVHGLIETPMLTQLRAIYRRVAHPAELRRAIPESAPSASGLLR